MTIKQNGGVFGRNPTFNDVTIEGDLILNGETFTGLDFNGSWNASTNSPTLSSGTGTQGEFYIVSVAGTTALDGVTNWGVGDYCFFNGTAWQRIEGGADGNFVNASVSGTLSSSNLTNASGDITLDASGDITLDADGADIRFKDGGSTIALAKMDSSNFTIQTNNNDKDIIFKGYDSDGGGLITALTLDMSDAGTATFNSTVKTDTFQNSSGNLNILSTESILIRFDSDNSQTNRELNIQSNSSTQLFKLNENGEMTHSGTASFAGAVTANAGVVVDNVTLDANKIATSSGNFTIDSASDIILDCDGANIFLKDDTTSFGKFNKNGNNLKISAEVENGDIIFAGDDDGTPVTMLTLDASNAGAATFNSTVTSPTLVTDNIFVADDIKHTDDSDTYISFDSNSQIFYSGGTRSLDLNPGSVVINEGSGDQDFRVESNLDTHALFVNAGSDYVNIRSSATPSSSVKGFMFTADQFYTSAGSATSLNTQVRFINGNGLVGSITTDASATAFNTSSDYRLKENVSYTWDATTRLKQLKPIRFNFISDSNNTLIDGFLAHEVSDVVPNAVSGTKDAPIQENGDGYQFLDHSKLVPLLVKTIQELEARIAALES